ncbi:MAG: hypothetical protein V1921_05380 [Candidatus Altiarchaeota archaeon]
MNIEKERKPVPKETERQRFERNLKTLRDRESWLVDANDKSRGNVTGHIEPIAVVSGFFVPTLLSMKVLGMNPRIEEGDRELVEKALEELMKGRAYVGALKVLSEFKEAGGDIQLLLAKQVPRDRDLGGGTESVRDKLERETRMRILISTNEKYAQGNNPLYRPGEVVHMLADRQALGMPCKIDEMRMPESYMQVESSQEKLEKTVYYRWNFKREGFDGKNFHEHASEFLRYMRNMKKMALIPVN